MFVLLQEQGLMLFRPFPLAIASIYDFWVEEGFDGPVIRDFGYFGQRS
jgi:hypothetical protein